MTRETAGASREGLGEQRRRGFARAAAQDYPERKRVPRRRPIPLPVSLRVAAGAVVAALLFLGYLRVSWTVAATSDGAAQALQARDMPGAPAARAGDVAEEIPAAAVRATFGRPARVYRFDGFTVDVWDVNLLTKMGG